MPYHLGCRYIRSCRIWIITVGSILVKTQACLPAGSSPLRNFSFRHAAQVLELALRQELDVVVDHLEPALARGRELLRVNLAFLLAECQGLGLLLVPKLCGIVNAKAWPAFNQPWGLFFCLRINFEPNY